jgi:hypothetical protein
MRKQPLLVVRKIRQHINTLRESKCGAFNIKPGGVRDKGAAQLHCMGTSNNAI